MIKRLVKKCVPKWLFLYLLRGRDSLGLFKLAIASKSRVFSWLFMMVEERFLTSYFDFAKAAYRYEKTASNGEFNLYILRRNIHRIEKGLTMRPMRQEFALRFIEPTARGFCNMAAEEGFDGASEYNWAAGVLNAYFEETSSSDNRYLAAKKCFTLFLGGYSSVMKEEIPLGYECVDSEKYSEVLTELCRHRKSVRWFKSRPVEEVSIIKALECATLAPSSCNRQPYRYDVIFNEELAVKVANISAGTAGWSQNVNCIAVLVGDMSAFSNVANRHSIYVDGTLSVMPFVLSLEAQGLSTCIINWADISFRELEVRKTLGLKAYEKVILSIAIGYAEEDIKVPFSKRKSVSEISRFVS
jgi:nitroreductase